MILFLAEFRVQGGSWSLEAALQIGTAVNHGESSEMITERDTVPAHHASASNV